MPWDCRRKAPLPVAEVDLAEITESESHQLDSAEEIPNLISTVPPKGENPTADVRVKLTPPVCGELVGLKRLISGRLALQAPLREEERRVAEMTKEEADRALCVLGEETDLQAAALEEVQREPEAAVEPKETAAVALLKESPMSVPWSVKLTDPDRGVLKVVDAARLDTAGAL